MEIARGCLDKKVAYGHKIGKFARGCLDKKVAYGHKVSKLAGGCLDKKVAYGQKIPQSSPPPGFPHGFVLPGFRMFNLAGSARVAYGQKVAKFAGGCLFKKVAYGHNLSQNSKTRQGLLIQGVAYSRGGEVGNR